MSLEIDIIDDNNLVDDDKKNKLIELLALAAKMEEVEEGSELSVSFVSNEEIQEINRTYRGIDRPTDVISFALEETVEDEVPIIGEEMPRVLGDIIISVPKAKEQAQEYGHSFMRELGFLAVHGFLHLLGYDHQTKEEEQAMFGRQEEILSKFGLAR